MALSVADGTITITTGAIGTTFTVSGLSFQPKAITLFWSGRATTGQAEQDHKFGMGFAVSVSSRCTQTGQSDHGAGASATDGAMFTDCCVATLAVDGTLDGKADLDAITSDGFRLIIDDVFSGDLLVGWLAIGGSDLTNAEIVSFAEPAGTGNQDISVSFPLDTGADDKAVLFLGGQSQVGSPEAHNRFCLGVAAGNAPANAVLAGMSNDSQVNAVTMSYCLAGECIAIAFNNLVPSRASMTAWLSTGFRLNWAEVDSTRAPQFFALVLKGGRWQVGDALTSTGTTNQTEATSYLPVALLVASHNKAQSTSDTTQTHDERSVGVATSPTSRRSAGILDKDGAATMDIGVAFREDEMYINQSTAATIVIEGLMDLVSFDATPGFTYVMDDADPAQEFFWYLLCANAPAAAVLPERPLQRGIARRMPVMLGEPI